MGDTEFQLERRNPLNTMYNKEETRNNTDYEIHDGSWLTVSKFDMWGRVSVARHRDNRVLLYLPPPSHLFNNRTSIILL